MSIKHRVSLKIPAVGAIVRAGAFSNFARTLATLLTNGVQMFPALAIVENTVGRLCGLPTVCLSF